MRALVWLALAALMAAPALGQSATRNARIRLNGGNLTLQSSGSIQFPATTLTGTSQVVSATAAPTLSIIDARGSGQGWNVTLQSGAFTSGLRTIPATSFSYTAAGGTVNVVHGLSVGAGGPAETGVSGALSSSRKALAAQVGWGRGNYTWQPDAASFQLNLAPTTFAGTYAATVTMTLASGP